jgi:hypothetical protein
MLYPFFKMFLDERDTHILFQCSGRCHREYPSKNVSMMFTSCNELDKFKSDNIKLIIPIDKTSTQIVEDLY